MCLAKPKRQSFSTHLELLVSPILRLMPDYCTANCNVPCPSFWVLKLSLFISISTQQAPHTFQMMLNLCFVRNALWRHLSCLIQFSNVITKCIAVSFNMGQSWIKTEHKQYDQSGQLANIEIIRTHGIHEFGHIVSIWNNWKNMSDTNVRNSLGFHRIKSCQNASRQLPHI